MISPIPVLRMTAVPIAKPCSPQKKKLILLIAQAASAVVVSASLHSGAAREGAAMVAAAWQPSPENAPRPKPVLIGKGFRFARRLPGSCFWVKSARIEGAVGDHILGARGSGGSVFSAPIDLGSLPVEHLPGPGSHAQARSVAYSRCAAAEASAVSDNRLFHYEPVWYSISSCQFSVCRNMEGFWSRLVPLLSYFRTVLCFCVYGNGALWLRRGTALGIRWFHLQIRVKW